jgi:putative pyruvate formate lyase activating enzyme
VHREAELSQAPFEAAYLALARSGELAARAAAATARLADCDLCARYCRVDRTAGLAGVACRTGASVRVASWAPHHGEEEPLRGRHGSGTIFFSWCNLRCLHCQNFDISWQGAGRETTAAELAAMMLALQGAGCHNINFVSPSHTVAQILAALVIAAEAGLRLPLVYNSGGYDSPEALALLDGVVDIYMPDVKYADSDLARRYSKVRDYVAVNRAALREMQRQVGDLVLDHRGIARRGLLVRHLILPGGLAGTAEVVRFLAEEISRHTYLNLMSQYRPCYRADERPELGRRPSLTELQEAHELARSHGLERLD